MMETIILYGRMETSVLKTHCWATTNLPERWLLKRRKALLTNSYRDDFANDKHDVISFYL
jgi:hypothetical protein